MEVVVNGTDITVLEAELAASSNTRAVSRVSSARCLRMTWLNLNTLYNCENTRSTKFVLVLPPVLGALVNICPTTLKVLVRLTPDKRSVPSCG